MTGLLIELELEDEAATKRFGEDLALALLPGDLVGLSGDLGAGKSTLARALIRAASNDMNMEVPSPTFTLVQCYQCPAPWKSISHYDLYRLEDPNELEELGLFEALDKGLVLMEWPEKADHLTPGERITITLEITEEFSRRAVLSGSETIMQRVLRSLSIREFLRQSWHGHVERRYLLGDASTRAYETALHEDNMRILMNAPPMTDGPIIQDGKPYSQIAHLAEDVRPFVAIASLLRNNGFCVPEIYAQDLENGFLLMENLGSEGIINGTEPVAGKYLATVGALAALHRINWPRRINLNDGSQHNIPDYDQSAMMIEVDLLIKWYAPRAIGQRLDKSKIAAFEKIWTDLIDRLAKSENSIVLRDYHSPNILWQAGCEGIDRVGMIDFQDAMYGPCAYDVASLGQDARVTVSAVLEQQLLDEYVKLRQKDQSDFDVAGFLESYAIMSAQRAMKLIGLWVRLDERDGKPHYLVHLARTKSYLKRALRHPVLADLKTWLAMNVGL